jgi:hypothetical protein
VPAERIQAAAQALRAREGLEEALRLRFADVETVLANLQAYNAGLVDDLREFRGSR